MMLLFLVFDSNYISINSMFKIEKNWKFKALCDIFFVVLLYGWLLANRENLGCVITLDLNFVHNWFLLKTLRYVLWKVIHNNNNKRNIYTG